MKLGDVETTLMSVIRDRYRLIYNFVYIKLEMHPQSIFGSSVEKMF